MFLAIDSGNTNTVFAVFEGDELRGEWRAATDTKRTADEYAVWLTQLMAIEDVKHPKVSGAIIASVVPAALFALVELCRRYFASEPLVVGLTPTVTTETHDAAEAVVTSVLIGITVHDKATVTGTGPTPTGSVGFTFYANGTCTPVGSPTGSVLLDGFGVAHPSDSETPLAAGSYSFRALYNGDGNYLSAWSACEPLTVTAL
ncbi:MAG: type III pantothenate kinase [Proteobacteria bacterium]|nr:type III pantothenate kinase [Pseudomonadota bacterium]